MTSKVQKKFNIQAAVSRFREDIVLANPVNFLVRAMNGEEFDGDVLNLRERVEVAKFLGARILPTVVPEERGVGVGQAVTPPPLTIVLHSRVEDKQGGLDTMTVVGEHRVESEVSEDVKR